MIVVAIGAIVWVGVSTFLFANLCSSISDKQAILRRNLYERDPPAR